MRWLVVLFLLLLTGCPAPQEEPVVVAAAPAPTAEPSKELRLPAPVPDPIIVTRDYNKEAKDIAAQMQSASVVFTVPKEINIKEIISALEKP